ncbi:hypothetical protein L211DRAFT_853398 [Terfezia boudieri ATCC MYA-4762]|uniref:Uncharacterized protein n=1 Tax=Terfezia boudieri ATCC MYA-4762 TaxID=1051890 RepID=A0A3N4L8H8_9PEZI|nr:hypothetical protein L211DRAFT_853398 [Terfezia boudieri ATCC MYA-4762]
MSYNQDDMDPWREPKAWAPPVTPRMQPGYLFNEGSFDIPYADRTPQFYEWRQRVIDEGTQMSVSAAAKLAATAQEDYYQQLLSEASQGLEGWKKRAEEMEAKMQKKEDYYQRLVAKASLECRQWKEKAQRLEVNEQGLGIAQKQWGTANEELRGELRSKEEEILRLRVELAKGGGEMKEERGDRERG